MARYIIRTSSSLGYAGTLALTWRLSCSRKVVERFVPRKPGKKHLRFCIDIALAMSTCIAGSRRS